MQLTSPELITAQAEQLTPLDTTLAEFYIAIDDWVHRRTVAHYFSPSVGLCQNYINFVLHDASMIDLTYGGVVDRLKAHLAKHFTDYLHSFYSHLQPCERSNAYDEDRQGTMYSNPHRLAWITKWADIARIQLGYPLES